MTTYAVDAGRRAWGTLPRIGAWLDDVRPATLLVPAIVLQWVLILALALTVQHNGWLYYQGGDQLWYYISGWAAVHGHIPPGFVGPGWPAVLGPISLFGGPTLVPALPAIVLLNVLVFGPIELLCVYGIARQIGGKIFAYWATALWLAVPFIGIKYTDYLYHQRYTELTLPQAFGLTAMADYPSMVAVLVSAYFAIRVAKRPDVIEALACGIAAGLVITTKPSNAAFLLGVVLALAWRRRFLMASYVVAGMVPALLTLSLWKYRGLGYLPILHSSAGVAKLAAGPGSQLVAFNPIHHYIHFNWHQLNENLLAIKEHFWSMRIIEWLVIAGIIGLARRSFVGVLLVGGWFAAFVVTKGTYAGADVTDSSLLRVMMPSFPAFVLLIASLVYLFPGTRRRRAEPELKRSPQRRRRILLASGVAIFALYPLALVAAASPLRGPKPAAYVAYGLLRSIDPSLRLTATASGPTVHLTWRESEPWGTAVFYRIWRTNAANGGATCTAVAHGADNCQLTMDDIGAHTGTSFADKPGPGTWTYRLALAANWENSPLYGDVYSLGPPVTVRVR